LYNGGDAPPQYFAPPGATKANPNQNGQQMEPYGAPTTQGPPVAQGPQQSGVVGAGDVEQGAGLPPRPPQKAKAVLKGFTDRFRK
jgi:hypothetical protein